MHKILRKDTLIDSAHKRPCDLCNVGLICILQRVSSSSRNYLPKSDLGTFTHFNFAPTQPLFVVLGFMDNYRDSHTFSAISKLLKAIEFPKFKI